MVELAYNGNHSLRLPIIADYNQAYAERFRAQRLGVQARAPDPSSAPSPGWIRRATITTTASPRASSIASPGPVFPEFVHLVEGAWAIPSRRWNTYAGYYEANPQNIHNWRPKRGPSSFDVKFNNVTSVVYQLPFGKGASSAPT